MRKSFALRVFCFHYLVIAVPLLINSFFFFHRSFSESIERARGDLKETTEYRAITITELAPVPETFLRDTSYFLNLSEGVDEKTTRSLKDLSDIVQVLFYVLEIPSTPSDSFKVISASDPDWVGREIPNSYKLQTLISRGYGSFFRYLKPSLEKQELTYVEGEVIKKNEVPTAVLFAFSLVKEGLDRLLDSKRDVGIEFALLGEKGSIIDSSKHDLMGNYFDPLSEQDREEIIHSEHLGQIKLANAPLETVKSPEGFSDFMFGKEHYIAYRVDRPENGFSLITFAPKKQFLQASLKHLIIFYVNFTLYVICGAILAYFLSLWISRPLRQISTLMEQAKKGDYTGRFIPQTFGSEINLLGHRYNTTLEALLLNMKRAEDEHVARMTYQKELELGREVQENLLSATTDGVEALSIATRYLPAKEVGGDFYCIEKQGDDAIWFVVGDASGKGISSCIFALAARSLMRSYATQYDKVETICSMTNDAFLQDTGDSGMFVTALMGLYFPKTGKLSYYSCGHVPGIVRKKNGTLITLEHKGMALGLLESEGYRADEIELEKGDLILFYTKGLIDGENERHQYFSQERIKDLLQHRKWETVDEVVNGFTSEFTQFTSNETQEDEVVIMAIEIL
ncbi:MAG: hypothetical protein S4CHLAM45_10490 [Chlamydiales bacterium]|nr:hypothetical protein [Chlamydiales bacterium]MCH9619543.1 hypothetical protein [Chlamydiales bacterium]MCH9623149.1 hypothetical protein [Chlamydiales bacterium]